MTFVNATLLAGTALVALPIILHLIMRRKPKLFEFPALRFIQKRHDTNQRRLKLRHLLLLLLRAAAIALLAMALARPSVQFAGSLGSEEAPVAAALIFDAAPRMQYRQENETRLQVAKTLGQWMLAQLPAESQVAVLDTRLGPAAFQADRGSARQRIGQLDFVPNSQPLTSAIEEAARLLKKSADRDRKEIYVFTDMAQAAWPADSAASLQERLAELGAAGIYVIDVGAQRPINFGLGDVRLSGQVLSSRSTLVINSELSFTDAGKDAANVAKPESRAVELYRLDANRQPQVQSINNIEIAPGQARQFEFRMGGLTEGTHQGYLRIVGQDGLAADDTRYFSVQVKPPWRVLVVAPTRDHAHYLNAALAPESFRRRGQSRFDCETIDPKQLTNVDLAPFSAVFLLDPGPLEPLVWKRLADYVAEGHGLGVFLGRNAGLVEPFQTSQALEVLPGRMASQARRPDGDCYLAPRDYQHPALAAFRGISGSVPWEAFPVFRYWTFEDTPQGVSVILRLNDHSPVLFERPLGAGRVLTLATPISDRADAKAWNLLPVGVIDNAAPFVMLINQIAGYLVGAADDQLNYTCGQTAVVQLEAKNQFRNFVLLAPGDLSLSLSSDAKQQRLTISATEQPGNYRIVAGGRTEGVDLGFSVNLSPQQTELTRLPGEQLRDLFGPFPYRLARTREEIDRSISSGRVGRELFTPLILLVGLVLAAELFVSNKFYKE